MKPTHILALIICIAITLLAGSISGIATAASIHTWYAFLIKPSFNPPNYLFGPVWTLLYILMGISLFLIWRSPPGKPRYRALIVFWVQLTLNFTWSFIFFYFRQTGWAFVEIILIWISILAMILIVYRVNKTASLLQIPYLLWVSFAGILNGMIWWLN